MKVLHIMGREKFTEPVAKFYNAFFDNGEHEICYLNVSGEPSIVIDAVQLKQHELFLTEKHFNDLKLIKDFFIKHDYDYIVMHSYLTYRVLKLFFYLNRKFLNKVVWIEWGADLYQWRKVGGGLLGKITNAFEKKLRTACDSVVAIFPPDIDFYKQEFPKTNVNIYYAPYIVGDTLPKEFSSYCEASRLSETLLKKESIYIQIGHHSTPQLNHIAVLDALKKFSNEDIKLLLPLNYGNQDYANEVQAYAERAFPEKVICLREMLSEEEYFRLIERVDIAIFNTQRQIALGNINRMIFRNVKLYMPADSVMYKYFSSEGVPIQAFDAIINMSFEKFISKQEVKNRELFENFIKGISNMDIKVNYWKDIYDDLRKRVEVEI